jgi:molecular chaperone DnaK (HSP70)
MNELTTRQSRTIPFIVTSPTIIEGVTKAGITTKTYYQWLEQPEFKAELDRQREEVAQNALDTLTQSLAKAVENLVKLLDNTDNRLRRLACKDVIEYILKHREIEDLDKRLTAIEQRLSEKTN